MSDRKVTLDAVRKVRQKLGIKKNRGEESVESNNQTTEEKIKSAQRKLTLMQSCKFTDSRELEKQKDHIRRLQKSQKTLGSLAK